MTKPTSPEYSPVTQSFGTLVPVRLGLSEQVRHRSVAALNRLLAHSMAIRDLYKKAHWQTSGRSFTSCICCSTSATKSSWP